MEEGPQDREPRLGPASAGDEMQRLIDDLRSKGMSAGQLEALRGGWEAACHDPMRKGRGGPSLPENSPKGRVPLPDPPPEPPAPRTEPASAEREGVGGLLGRTTPWPGPDQHL